MPVRMAMILPLALCACPGETNDAGDTSVGTSTGSETADVSTPAPSASTSTAPTTSSASSDDDGTDETTAGSTSPDASSSSTGDAAIDANVAFVTSQAWPPAELGGLAGADAHCQAAAEAAGLPANTYLAWLATAASTPYGRGRLGDGSRGWVRPDGRPFADLLHELVADGPQWYLLRLDEHGNDVGPVRVPAGTPPLVAGPTEMCADWTTDDLSDVWGAWNSQSGWDWWGNLLMTDACDNPLRLFCFGADLDTPVSPPEPESGRWAFLSTPFTVPSGGGLEAADAHCNADATEAGLVGDFAAALPTSTTSAAARFDLDGEGWVRPDGLWFMEDPHALDGGVPDLPLEIRADGILGTLYPVSRHFTGAPGPTQLCTQCCADWTDPNGSAYAAESDTTEYRWYDDAITTACSVEHTLLCLER